MVLFQGVMNSTLPHPVQITLKVARVLERLEIQYLIGGSLASAVYGVFRATVDADLVADLHIEQIKGFCDPLQDDFYTDPAMILDAIKIIFEDMGHTVQTTPDPI